jgi:hypothetical protein
VLLRVEAAAVVAVAAVEAVEAVAVEERSPFRASHHRQRW